MKNSCQDLADDWSAALPHSSATVAIRGEDGRYLSSTPTFSRLLGRDTVQGLTDQDCFPLEVAKHLSILNHRVRQEGQSACEFEPSSRLMLVEFPLSDDSRRHAVLSGVVVVEEPRAAQDLRQALQNAESNNRELQQNLADLESIAATDRLTGTRNRHFLERHIPNEIARAEQQGGPLSVLMIDVDHFKSINDAHGHACGDEVLCELAERLRGALRASDVLVRWGGEEFLVLCPDTPQAAAARLAERLRLAVATLLFSRSLQVTISLGLAARQAGESWQPWFERADAALYRAKAGGRNRVEQASFDEKESDAFSSVGFLQLSWRRAYESGHDGIDAEHQTLFAISNQLLDAVLQMRSRESIAELIARLLADVSQHFQHEEAVMHAAGYPQAEQHAAIHAGLLAQAYALCSRFEQGEASIGELFQFLAHEVIARHMLREDRLFFPYLNGAHA
ncbi:bacteriohemerythrin [Craterilacuibacter sp. RT1T]|uniref:bacteriohemerythrin n=1 Tax=Craterilacuibacter sp. RT1T TaxID=2942211 RepID=UPI0020BD7948|nr:bacteriohemerythrin [Craterilacuibacter sp. RT1T]MCL6263415.1 bacteriohemerythrin [Craterilacuibacter sp. RT1T]